MTDPRIAAVVVAAKSLPFNGSDENVEDFAARTLGIVATAVAALQGGQFLDDLIATLQSEHNLSLTEGCEVPPYVIYRPVAGGYRISGTATYISRERSGTRLAHRAGNVFAVQTAVDTLPSPDHLEALAAALLRETMEMARATPLVADHGVDALGYSNQMDVFWPFTLSAAPAPGTYLGERRFVIASSKATKYHRSATSHRPLLDPKYVRELIGSWVVQRHEQGMWSKHGIKMLSALQLILITTYRISPEARKLCKALGVDVWMIPELVCLISQYAPDIVFPAANAHLFDGSAFTAWVEQANIDRFPKP